MRFPVVAALAALSSFQPGLVWADNGATTTPSPTVGASSATISPPAASESYDLVTAAPTDAIGVTLDDDVATTTPSPAGASSATMYPMESTEYSSYGLYTAAPTEADGSDDLTSHDDDQTKCSNGLPGVENSDYGVCCAADCGTCGGEWCNAFGGGESAGLGTSFCCVQTILGEGDLCSDTGSAPCIIGA